MQSLSPSQGSASWGAARRRGPTGGRAKGIPRNCFTLLSVPFTAAYSPRIGPFVRDTTRSVIPAEDRMRVVKDHSLLFYETVGLLLFSCHVCADCFDCVCEVSPVFGLWILRWLLTVCPTYSTVHFND